ncbi:uncharacterized protein GGS22DRAFT_187657 [Annulohypoxylon maeteangense]|uniref:uncharacterized protein n=1 Tax=Annulohypoxylon maeteangense TaxID=1927788 RepID=UPI002007E47A|nr:uncharacterized protein GGS22DRAFT_187657 [Annulohypoxylon maeteangense]KAI0886415.1 hypothetical protein GGS22DRAFT_187657 [Annulohypoxylon maeteangense]
MSHENEKFLLHEDHSRPSDMVFDQHLRDHKACCASENGCRSSEHHLRIPTFLLSPTYILILHIFCFLLGISLVLKTIGGVTDVSSYYSDWVPISHELLREEALDTPETKFTGLPNDVNTKAWDDLITREYSLQIIGGSKY